MQLTIIRHGESANNQLVDKTADHDDFLAHRSPDPDLTARGERQAELVARHLAASEHPEAGGSLTRLHLIYFYY
jgi:broad specificity phosphatase PhoE